MYYHIQNNMLIFIYIMDIYYFVRITNIFHEINENIIIVMFYFKIKGLNKYNNHHRNINIHYKQLLLLLFYVIIYLYHKYLLNY